MVVVDKVVHHVDDTQSDTQVWTIFLTIMLTAVVVLGIAYAFHVSVVERMQTQYNLQIDDLQDEIQEMRLKENIEEQTNIDIN